MVFIITDVSPLCPSHVCFLFLIIFHPFFKFYYFFFFFFVSYTAHGESNSKVVAAVTAASRPSSRNSSSTLASIGSASQLPTFGCLFWTLLFLFFSYSDFLLEVADLRCVAFHSIFQSCECQVEWRFAEDPNAGTKAEMVSC